MRNISSSALALMALALSSLTTYLTFFDARYALTAAVANVSASVQTGFSSSEAGSSVSYRTFVAPSIIVSNRGTRPVVVTAVEAVLSPNTSECASSDTVRAPQFEALIIEPNTVENLKFEFGLPGVDAQANAEGAFELFEKTELWCLRWTVFDHTGRRTQPLTALSTFSTVYRPADDDSRYPTADIDADTIHAPMVLAKSGIF